MNKKSSNFPRANGGTRSAAIRTKVLQAMRAIRQEIALKHEKPGPHRNITAKELASRAGIHPTTFHTLKQRALGARVKIWVRLLNSRAIEQQVKPSRRSVEDRLADWRQRYMGLAQAHRDTELDLHQALAELAEAQFELTELRKTNADLSAELKQLGALRVVSLPKKVRDNT